MLFAAFFSKHRGGAASHVLLNPVRALDGVSWLDPSTRQVIRSLLLPSEINRRNLSIGIQISNE